MTWMGRINSEKEKRKKESKKNMGLIMKQNQNKWCKTWSRRRGTTEKRGSIYRETKDREDHERYGENKTRRFTRLETERKI